MGVACIRNQLQVNMANSSVIALTPDFIQSSNLLHISRGVVCGINATLRDLTNEKSFTSDLFAVLLSTL